MSLVFKNLDLIISVMVLYGLENINRVLIECVLGQNSWIVIPLY